jgi:(1->4)-alpha-D-glucan 1-alpha-D-glucosylmutase
MEHLVYQSIVGAWPIERERMRACMEKAAREAKVHTSWLDPSPGYESALMGFVDALYGDGGFLAEVEETVRAVLEPGRVNALAMTLLQLTSPGVPDVYQGSEVWNLALVDPDNRRPVDFVALAALMRRSHEVSARDAWLRECDSGLPKLLLVRRALELRAQRPSLFGAEGDYLPLHPRGERAEHVIAFARGAPPGAVTVVPRWPLRLGGSWGDTTLPLPEGEWQDQLTGAVVHGGGGEASVAELLRDFPVALLARAAA